jgi:DNA polymerase bacteriophage-type
MPITFIDFESSSLDDLKTSGAKLYSQGTSTKVLCFAYAIDDGPIQSMVAGPIPDDLARVLPATTLGAHNARFEYLIWSNVLVPRHGWPPITMGKFICSMSMAEQCGLPRSLKNVAKALGLREQKDTEGRKLMLDIATHKAELTPERLERLQAYCRQDIAVERELFLKLARRAEFDVFETINPAIRQLRGMA